MIIRKFTSLLDEIPWNFWERNMVNVSVSYCYVTSKHKKILVAYNTYLAHASAGQLYASVDLKWNVHASRAGWRLTDLSAGWLGSSVLTVDPLLLTASLRVSQAVYLGHVFVMAMAEVQEGKPHCKSQLCVKSAKIPLAKASFKADPEVKGWANTLIHAYTGELQSHLGKSVDIGRGKIISQNATYLHHSTTPKHLWLYITFSLVYGDSFLCLSL